MHASYSRQKGPNSGAESIFYSDFKESFSASLLKN